MKIIILDFKIINNLNRGGHMNFLVLFLYYFHFRIERYKINFKMPPHYQLNFGSF